MEILTANQVNVIVDKLDRAGVEYLQFDAYNEEDYSEKYQSEYIDLFEEIVVNKIFKHFGIDPQDNETIVGYFAKENGKWIVWFNEPEATATFEDILNGNYSSLKELRNW
ncbi:hypothetical protein [Limosilactobacillus reuteri]|uniref:hypothetical protein n=1 Tax=Limosilactobacillus reuteri TaxID=1598 RepID=UPI002B05DAF7|nr:hypothetical protein [Limosilactobacillus reuteri]